MYHAFEEVGDDDDLHLISSRWVIAEKEDSETKERKVKPRLCVRGFE